MTKARDRSGRANRVVRRPATCFAHLQKRMRQGRLSKGIPRVPPEPKK